MKRFISLLFALIIAVCVFPCAFAATETEISDVSASTAQAQVIKPEKVTGLAVYETTQTSIELKWNSAKNADGYNVYIYNETAKKYKLKGTTEELTYTVEGLTAGTVYKFKVTGLRAEDGEIIKGVSGEALTAVTVPKSVSKIVTADISENSVSLSWSASKGATQYEVWVYKTEEDKFVLYGITQQRSMTVKSLQSNSVYTFKIRPCITAENAVAYGDYTVHIEYTDTNSLAYTKAQAARSYNSAVNSTKAVNDMTVTLNKSVTTNTLSCSKNSLLRTVKNMMNLFAGEMEQTYVFKNGTSGDVTPLSLIEPIKKAASLRADDIKSFSVSKKKSTTTLKLTLKEDEAEYDGKTTQNAKHNARAIKTVKIGSFKTQPVSVNSAVQYISGADISAVISSKGRLKKLSISSPATVKADCSVSTIDFETEVSYVIDEIFTFKY